jgi:hypothetical protein
MSGFGFSLGFVSWVEANGRGAFAFPNARWCRLAVKDLERDLPGNPRTRGEMGTPRAPA